MNPVTGRAILTLLRPSPRPGMVLEAPAQEAATMMPVLHPVPKQSRGANRNPARNRPRALRRLSLNRLILQSLPVTSVRVVKAPAPHQARPPLVPCPVLRRMPLARQHPRHRRPWCPIHQILLRLRLRSPHRLLPHHPRAITKLLRVTRSIRFPVATEALWRRSNASMAFPATPYGSGRVCACRKTIACGTPLGFVPALGPSFDRSEFAPQTWPVILAGDVTNALR